MGAGSVAVVGHREQAGAHVVQVETKAGEGSAGKGPVLLAFECHAGTQHLAKSLCAGTQGPCSWEHLRTKASKIQPALGSPFGLVEVI